MTYKTAFLLYPVAWLLFFGVFKGSDLLLGGNCQPVAGATVCSIGFYALIALAMMKGK